MDLQGCDEFKILREKRTGLTGLTDRARKCGEMVKSNDSHTGWTFLTAVSQLQQFGEISYEGELLLS